MKLKKNLAAALAAVLLLTLCSCSSKEENKTAEPAADKKTEAETVQATEEPEEEVEIIYATTPEEAADKCLAALYSGNYSDAKHYVDPTGSAFKELNNFKEKTLNSIGVANDKNLKESADKLLKNVLASFSYTRTNTKTDGNTATVTYSVSVPDMENLDYSKYMDQYMAAKGISIEALMMELEGMSEAESEAWSKEFSLNVLNYIFESGVSINRTTQTTTVTVKKEKKGWLVSEIQNLAS